MKPFIFFVLLFTTHSFAQNDSFLPIEKTCSDLSNRSGEAFLKMSKERAEALNDQDLYKAVYSVGGFAYNSVLLFHINSVRIAEAILKANIASFSKYPNYSTLNPDFISLLKHYRSYLEESFKNASPVGEQTKNRIYYDLRNETQTNNNLIISISKVLKKIPIHTLISTPGILSSMLPKNSNKPMTFDVDYAGTRDDMIPFYEGLTFYLIDLIEKQIEHPNQQVKDIYSDIYEFAYSHFKNKEKAQEVTMLTLGSYATRGATITSTFYNHISQTAALHLLSLVISYFDKIAHTQDKSYMLPKNIKSNCHYGKPYHFWMSAFMSYYMKKQEIASSTAYLSPILGSIGYDLFTSNNGRDANKLFKITNKYDDYANATRIDLWMRALGSNYGTHFNRKLPIDADKILIRLFKKAQLPRKLPQSAEEKVLEYLHIIQPTNMLIGLSL